MAATIFFLGCCDRRRRSSLIRTDGGVARNERNELYNIDHQSEQWWWKLQPLVPNTDPAPYQPTLLIGERAGSQIPG